MGVLRILAYLALALFLVLYGLMAVTNFRVAEMATITGLSALLAGVLFVILVVRKEP